MAVSDRLQILFDLPSGREQLGSDIVHICAPGVNAAHRLASLDQRAFGLAQRAVLIGITVERVP